MALAGLACAGALGVLAGWTATADDPPLHALSAATLFAAYLVWRALDPRRAALAIPYPVVLGLLVVAVLLGMANAEAPQLNSALAFLTWPLVAIVACDVARADGVRRIVPAIAAAVLGTGAGIALLGWVTGFSELKPFTPDSSPRLSWPFEHPNLLGAFCAVLIPLAVVAAVTARGRSRWPALLAISLGGSALIASASRAAWLGALVGVALVLCYRLALRPILAGLGVCLAAASPFIVARLSDPDTGTDNVRFGIWGEALTAFAQNPLTGVGHENFRLVATPIFEQPDASTVIHAHHLYLNFAAELGVLGLAAILLLLVSALATAHRGAAGGEDRPLAIGLLGALGALAAIGLLDYPIYGSRVLLVFWSLVGVAAALGIARRQGARAGTLG